MYFIDLYCTLKAFSWVPVCGSALCWSWPLRAIIHPNVELRSLNLASCWFGKGLTLLPPLFSGIWTWAFRRLVKAYKHLKYLKAKRIYDNPGSQKNCWRGWPWSSSHVCLSRASCLQKDTLTRFVSNVLHCCDLSVSPLDDCAWPHCRVVGTSASAMSRNRDKEPL